MKLMATDINNIMMKTMNEAIASRHSVRSYISEPLTAQQIDSLQKEIDRCNEESGLHIQLVTDEPKAFHGIASYGKFSGVENYFVMVGPKEDWLDSRVGYYGERLVLLAQSLGLNTCWVGLTYRKVSAAFRLGDNEKVACLIALGHGATQGRERKSKTMDKVSNANADSPEWFLDGVKAALLAPTAINQQKFYFELSGKKTPSGKPIVVARRLFSMVGYTQMDIGIARLHFELGAGHDNFEWKEKL